MSEIQVMSRRDNPARHRLREIEVRLNQLDGLEQNVDFARLEISAEKGRLYGEVKQSLGEGEWESWVKARGTNRVSANDYIRIAFYYERIRGLGRHGVQVPEQFRTHKGLVSLCSKLRLEDEEAEKEAKEEAERAAQEEEEMSEEERIRRQEEREKAQEDARRKEEEEAQRKEEEEARQKEEKEAKKWSGDQRHRQELCLRGISVLADMHGDFGLIEWAKEEGRFHKIDRSTKLGNMMPMEWYDRAFVISWYRDHFLPFIPGEVLQDFGGGKVLGCWCYPLACHGDCILEVVNNDDPF